MPLDPGAVIPKDMDQRQWSRWAREQSIVADDDSVDTDAIQDEAVTLAKMADLAADTIIGRANGAGTGVPQALTVTQVNMILSLASGTYTPTLTNVANLDASTAFQCQYLRVGATVTVSGKVNVDPNTSTTATELGISLPIASNFGATEDCAGAAHSDTDQAEGGAIIADTLNDRAQLTWNCITAVATDMYFTFTYQVI